LHRNFTLPLSRNKKVLISCWKQLFSRVNQITDKAALELLNQIVEDIKRPGSI
jgi:hypothetical protein